LRSRAGKAPLADDSATLPESPESFFRQVKKAAKASVNNQDKLMATVRPQQRNREPSSSPNRTLNSNATYRKKVIS